MSDIPISINIISTLSIKYQATEKACKNLLILSRAMRKFEHKSTVRLAVLIIQLKSVLEIEKEKKKNRLASCNGLSFSILMITKLITSAD